MVTRGELDVNIRHMFISTDVIRYIIRLSSKHLSMSVVHSFYIVLSFFLLYSWWATKLCHHYSRISNLEVIILMCHSQRCVLEIQRNSLGCMLLLVSSNLCLSIFLYQIFWRVEFALTDFIVNYFCEEELFCYIG